MKFELDKKQIIGFVEHFTEYLNEHFKFYTYSYLILSVSYPYCEFEVIVKRNSMSYNPIKFEIVFEDYKLSAVINNAENNDFISNELWMEIYYGFMFKQFGLEYLNEIYNLHKLNRDEALKSEEKRHKNEKHKINSEFDKLVDVLNKISENNVKL